MYIKTTYEQEFDDLYMHLKAKYPAKLFDLDGIGKQLDMSAFSRNFFNSTVQADASIDANANCDDVSVIAYNTELPKPFFKLNSYYVLWKELKRLYGLLVANDIIEKQLTGDIYIHDMHGIGAGSPYSYYGKTVLCMKIAGELIYTTIEDFYNILQSRFPGRAINENALELTLTDVEILDQDNSWVPVSRILRHKPHCKMIELETKNGLCTIVTEDHPVMTDDGITVAASMTLDDTMVSSKSELPLPETKTINNDYAYFVGFQVGDGCLSFAKGKKCELRRGHIDISQKDITNTKIHAVTKKLFDNVTVTKQGRALKCGYKRDVEQLLDTGVHSHNRKLPNDILLWDKSAIKSCIAGLIDAEGNINNRSGICTIRVASFELIQQLGELFRVLKLGNTRTSFCGKFNGKNSYKSNYEIYRLSCRIEDREIAEYSERIRANYDIVYQPMKGTDGRFETNKLHKINTIKAPEYVYDITTASGHFHCQGLIQHNCFNYSTYDIMTRGLPMVKKVRSLPPKYLYSFKSQLEQFTVIASNSTLGATGLADLLVVMSYYVKNILATRSDAHFHFATEADCWAYIEENLVSFIYTVNQPMRANQSPFTNVSVYDNYFLDKICDDYVFPDMSSPDKAIIKRLQGMFLDIMNTELRRTSLTFPVTTACFSVDADHNIRDEEFLSFIAEKNREFGFINIFCGNSSILSSCCRLRSEQKSEYFNSFGSGSTKIGSLGVCSINFPRLAIKYPDEKEFMVELGKMVEVCARINNAKRHIIEKRIKNGNEPLYSLGFMELSKQYSTVGVNGFNECIELMGHDLLDESGQELAISILEAINAANARFQRQYNAPHNCEQVPGENMSIKMADKDKLLGYQDQYDIYSNQFIPLVASANLLDRIKLQGMFDSHFSGGSILHLNVDTRIEDVEDIKTLIRETAKKHVVYFAINYVLCECVEGHMSVGNDKVCPVCGKEITGVYTRVVGFLTNVKNWHRTRREQDFPCREFYQGVKIEPMQELS